MASDRPSFQWYVKDWLSSKHIAMMCAAEEGAYCRLLCYCWDTPDLTIPSDPNACRALGRLSEAEGDIGKVLACFQKVRGHPETLTHKRLIREKEKQDAHRANSRKGADTTNKIKKSRCTDASPVGERSVKGRLSSSSSSSTAATQKKEKSAADPKTAAGANGKRRTWMSPYYELWEAICKGKPPAGQLAKVLKPLHDEHGAGKVIQHLRSYLLSTEPTYINLPKFAATFGRWSRVDTAGKPADGEVPEVQKL